MYGWMGELICDSFDWVTRTTRAPYTYACTLARINGFPFHTLTIVVALAERLLVLIYCIKLIASHIHICFM